MREIDETIAVIRVRTLRHFESDGLQTTANVQLETNDPQMRFFAPVESQTTGCAR